MKKFVLGAVIILALSVVAGLLSCKGGTPTTPPNKERLESLKVTTNSNITLQLFEGEAFNAEMYVDMPSPNYVGEGKEPFHWQLLSDGLVAENVLLNPIGEKGQTLQVSGIAAHIGDPTTVAREGRVDFEVADSSQPTKWGRGSFWIRVNRKAEEKGLGLSGEWISRVPGTGYVLEWLNGPFTWYYDAVLNLAQSGNTITGSEEWTLRNVVLTPGQEAYSGVKEQFQYWKALVGTTTTAAITGTVSGNSVSIPTSIPGVTFSLTYTGDKLYGITTWNSVGIDYKSTFDLKRK